MITAIIIEDEKPSREALTNYIREFCTEVILVGTASSVKSGLRAIVRNKPDLVFLDIELGDGKGFDILRKIEKVNFKIIFVTAYSDYAIKAFRVNAVDYLLKPVKIDELQEAVRKALNSVLIEPDYGRKLDSLLNEVLHWNNNTLTIAHINGYDLLRIDEIIMCKADSYCTDFYMTDNRKVTSSKNLGYYENLLSDFGFLRVHHSYVINLKHVRSYSRQGEIWLTGGNKGMLGDSYKSLFIGKFSVK